MAGKKKGTRHKKEPTERQLAIKQLQSMDRDSRTEEDRDELKRLQAEERRDRFLRLAPARVNKALAAIANVARCGGRTGYEYYQEEAVKIIDRLTLAVSQAADEFRERDVKSNGFTL